MDAYYADEFVLPLPEGHRFPVAKYRLLRDRISRPLLNVEDLNGRLDQVDAFFSDALLRADPLPQSRLDDPVRAQAAVMQQHDGAVLEPFRDALSRVRAA